jgi:hypothetical protein
MTNKPEASYEEQLIEDIAGFTHDPLSYARYSFPWGEQGTELEHAVGPRTWQAEAFAEIRDHLQNPATRHEPCLIARASGHGIGKALRSDDIVPTPEGLRCVSDIRPGNVLFGEHGEAVKVIGTRNYDSCPFYRVTFSDGTAVDVSSGHLWKVRGRNSRRTGSGEWEVLETIDILERGVKRRNGTSMARQWEIPASPRVIYPARALPVDPYTYGVWLGDGDKAGGRITNIDSEVWENIAYPTRVDGKTRTAIGLKVDLVNAGLLGCTTYNASVDRRYIESERRLQVLQGLLDTDGWVEKSCGGAAFASASRQLTRDVIEIARSLGLRARNEKFKPNKFAGSWSTHITWDGKTRLFRIDRKQQALVAAEKRYTTKWIESIEPVAEGPGICFEVEGGIFLARDYIVTHNSAFISMLINWGMSTCEDCKVVVTANTDNQLRTKTWPEIIKWSNLAITKEWFTCTATAMYSNDPGHDKRWRADAIPWSEHNTEAFAGLHNERKRIIVVFDEASNIADLVWEVAEGALTDEDTEIIWVAFGNPTRNTGRFRECFRKYKHRWKCAQIDSRTVEGTNKQQLQKWVDDYGEDSDFVKVRVRGIFPDASELQFIPTGLTDEAMKRVVTAAQVAHAPVIIGVDPAYSGVDDAVIYLRQGLHSKVLWTGNKTTDDLIMAKRIADFEDQYQADAVFIDFGYGTGLKSIGDGWGRTWQLIPFGGGSTDPQMLNKRGEMFNSCKTWLKLGGALDDQETADDLSTAEYKVRVDGKIVIEPKEDIKERLGRSPGKGDALLLTFAFPVTKRLRIPGQESQQGKAVTEYDPWK